MYLRDSIGGSAYFAQEGGFFDLESLGISSSYLLLYVEGPDLPGNNYTIHKQIISCIIIMQVQEPFQVHLWVILLPSPHSFNLLWHQNVVLLLVLRYTVVYE